MHDVTQYGRGSVAPSYRLPLLACVVLLVGLGFTLNFTSNESSSDLALVFFALNGSFFGLMLSRSLSRQPISFETMAWYFAFVFFFLVPFAQSISGNWKWFEASNVSDGLLLSYVNLYILSAFIAFFVAYNLAKRRFKRRYFDPHEHFYYWVPWRAFIVGSGFMCLLLLYAADFGGIESLISRSARGESVEMTVGEQSDQRAILVIGNNIARPGLLFFALITLFLPSIAKHRRLAGWSALGPFSFVFFVFAILANLPTGPARYYVLSLAMLILAFAFRSQSVRSGVMLLFLTLGIYISSILDRLRYASWDLIGLFQFNRDYFFVGHFNSFETIAHCVLWVKEKGISFGAELVGVVLFWVPRSLWPGKPQTPSVEFSSGYLFPQYGFDVHNVGLSTLGTFYNSFGILGGLIFGLVMGCYAGVMDGRFSGIHAFYKTSREQLKYALPSLTLYPFLAGAFFMLLRGQVWMGFQWSISIAISYILIRKIAVRRARVRPVH